MAPEKVTEMVLNVDLKCSGCYKKVKKVICKIPQIRDQMFDVEKNKVKIIVVCCSPEKIRDKLCYKGGGAIQSIEIIEKPKPPADKPKPPADKPKPPADKPPEKPKPPADKPPEKPKPPADKPPEKPQPPPPKKPEPPTDKPKPPADKPPEGGEPKNTSKKADAGLAKMVYEPVHGYPQMYPPSAYPMVGYGQYYDQGFGGAPFQHGYGMPLAPPPPPPSYGGFGYDNGYNGYNGYNGNRSHYGGEEDGEGCSIM